MEISEIRIQGFGKHFDSTINLKSATFLIGENNAGKSTVLKALSLILSGKSSINPDDLYCFEKTDENGDSYKIRVKQAIITIKIVDLPAEAKNWRGFKGRILSDADGQTYIKYRKTYPASGKTTIEMQTLPKEFIAPVTGKEKKIGDVPGFDSINDIQLKELAEHLKKEPGDLATFRINSSNKDYVFRCLNDYISIYSFNDADNTENEWDENPGGIAPVVQSKLPNFLFIPSTKGEDNIDGKGALPVILGSLFDDLKKKSSNYDQAKKALDLLATEMNPNDQNSEFGEMMADLNKNVAEIFDNVGIKVKANLSDADRVIKPSFDINLYSNIKTDANHQGAGIVRAIVFSLLRFKANLDGQNADSQQRTPLIIGFEEPELFLHPNAADQMRELIYDLVTIDNQQSGIQIISTTHSPMMIDLSRKPEQMLIRLITVSKTLENANEVFTGIDNEPSQDFLVSEPFEMNSTEAFSKLQDKDKSYVKMLLKMDNTMNRAFFSKRVLLVEGDTELIVLKLTIDAMPDDLRNEVLHNWQILKVTGKPVLISVIKYFNGMNLQPFVLHDRDKGTQGAEKFNPDIANALTNASTHEFTANECIEDVLGFKHHDSDKPYFAYKQFKEFEENNKSTHGWKNAVPQKWQELVTQIFSSK